jgi:hypothetical protein
MALEALQGENTLNALASAQGVQPTPIVQGKRSVPTEGPRLLTARSGKREQADAALKAPWYQPIGQRKVAWEWLKKNYRCKTHA